MQLPETRQEKLVKVLVTERKKSVRNSIKLSFQIYK